MPGLVPGLAPGSTVEEGANNNGEGKPSLTSFLRFELIICIIK